MSAPYDPIPHDRHAANIELAIAYRLHAQYQHAMDRAILRGAEHGKVEAMPDRLAWNELEDRYNRLVDHWLIEPPATPAAAGSLVAFAAVVVQDFILGDLFQVGTLGGDKDRSDVLQVLAGVSDWITQLDHAEERKKYLAKDAEEGRR